MMQGPTTASSGQYAHFNPANHGFPGAPVVAEPPEPRALEPRPFPAAAAAAAPPHAPAAETPHRGRAKRVRQAVLLKMKSNRGAAVAFRALAHASPTAMAMVDDGVGVMSTQETVDALMGMYDESKGLDDEESKES